MPKWSNIAKLSERQEKTRAAQFEAQMLAMLAPHQPSPASHTPPPHPEYLPSAQPPPSAHATPSPAITTPIPDAIQISVTANGLTTTYNNLQSVPPPLRQQIVNTWLTTPTLASTTPPIFNAPHPSRAASPDTLPQPTARPRTLRFALTLNLLLPGAGQLYLGQPRLAAAYALPFLATFVATLAIFLRAYAHYLTLATTGDLLEPGSLETLAHTFPAGLLTTLTIISTAIYIASTIHLILSRRSRA
jgi:hypothetical protein